MLVYLLILLLILQKNPLTLILLEKDLMVLEDGIIEGRKTYANMIKYIKMTASSNFGNMFSVLAASAFLPFLPMASIHLILLNLIYDISCTAIPWDNVDKSISRNHVNGMHHLLANSCYGLDQQVLFLTLQLIC